MGMKKLKREKRRNEGGSGVITKILVLFILGLGFLAKKR